MTLGEVKCTTYVIPTRTETFDYVSEKGYYYSHGILKVLRQLHAY